MKHTRKLVALLALLATLTACGTAAGAPTPDAPQVDEPTATAMAAAALGGLNDGDYAAWSRDWSDTMKAAIKEADFLAFRETVLATFGRYVEVKDATLSSVRAGTYRWTFTVAFERGEATIAFAFVDGAPKIEGVFTN